MIGSLQGLTSWTKRQDRQTRPWWEGELLCPAVMGPLLKLVSCCLGGLVWPTGVFPIRLPVPQGLGLPGIILMVQKLCTRPGTPWVVNDYFAPQWLNKRTREHEMILSVIWNILAHTTHMCLMWRRAANCKVERTDLQFWACKPIINKHLLNGIQLS